MIISKSQEQTCEITKEIYDKLKDGGLLCLYGDLGSGKTTFTKALASNFGIESFAIKSPTYTYIRQYPLKKGKLYHIDLYRLESIDELLWQEIQEHIDNEQNVIIIEWADRAAQQLPTKRIDISFEYLDEHSRKIVITE